MQIRIFGAGIFVVIGLFFVLPNLSYATSGACSYHGGVNCSAGASLEGKVVCNDGWVNSSVYYSDAQECEMDCPMVFHNEATYNQLKKDNEDAIARIKTDTQIACENAFQSDESFNNQSYQSCVDAIQTSVRLSGGMNLVSTNCEAEKGQRTSLSQSKKVVCLSGSDDIIFKYQRLNSCLVLDARDQCTVNKPNSHTQGSLCVCNNGYILEANGLCVPPVVVVPMLEQIPKNSLQCFLKYGKNNWYNPATNKCEPCINGRIIKDGQCVAPETIPTPTTKTQAGVVTKPAPQKKSEPTVVPTVSAFTLMALKATTSVSENIQPQKASKSRGGSFLQGFLNLFGFWRK